MLDSRSPKHAGTYDGEPLETEAVELPGTDGEQVGAVRPLPVPAQGTELAVWSDEVKTAALAAAGGVLAGAATVAVVRATRAATSPKKRGRRMLRGKERPQQVVASRSFLVDVHLLGSK